MTATNGEHEYWGRVAARYDAATDSIIGEETRRETERWLSHQFRATDDVLEMGCGTGSFSLIIAGSARNLTATDGAPEMLELARTRLRALNNVTVLREDCYHTSFPDGTFDGVFLGNLIHIVRNPADVLTECRRILRDDGRIVAVDATSSGMPFPSRLAMGVRYLKTFGLPPRENRIMGPDDLAALAEQGGFVVEELQLIERETNAVCLSGRKRR